jgi:UDP-glucuronate 4-epimerase
VLVLLTGAAGFIGSHLAERLLSLGEEVVGLDDLDDYYPPETKRRNLEGARRFGPAFDFVEGDVRDGKLLAGLFAGKKFDAVVHLAARAGVRPSLADPLLYADVNVGGTIQVMEAARAAGVRRFVLASSSSVYGVDTPAPFREDAPCLRPVSPYAASKRAMEYFARVFHELHGPDVACLRFFTVYGPRQRPDMAIHKFARLIEAGRPVPFFGDGGSQRDYTYVDDAVSGTLAALYRSRGFEVYNLGESRTVSLRELIGLLEKALGKPAKLDRQPDQPGDVPLTSADLSKSRRMLGYQPSVPVEEGLARFVRWLRQGEGQAR